MSLHSGISIPSGRDLIEVNGARYKYSKLMSRAVVWPVMFDEAYGGRLVTRIRGQHHLRLRPFRGVRMVLPDGGDTERGIVGGVIGENGTRLVYPVWLERWNFEYCVLLELPFQRAWDAVKLFRGLWLSHRGDPIVSATSLIQVRGDWTLRQVQFIMVNPRLRIAAPPARRGPSGTQGNPIVVEDDLTPIPQFSDNRPTIAFLTS
ncbi:hypothetical protein BC629DRAFT_1592871 [Irpex lacteus]|nr:hypothetical protein BC629DRAFT_1592871 [Irpex lacteus]